MGLSGDHNPLYVDVEHARSSHFGEVIVPGALLAAVVGGLGSMDVPVPVTVGLVGLSWNFLHPVRLGDTIGSHWRLNRKRPVANPGWGLAVWQVEVINQHGTVVATGEVTRLVGCREQPAELAAPAKTGRRRRRKAPEAPPAPPPMPSKPMPGALVGPVTEPAAAPTAPEAAEAPAEPPPPTTPSRRRRRSRGGGQPSAPAETPVQPAAEPVPPPPPSESAASTPPAPMAKPLPEPWVPPAEPEPEASTDQSGPGGLGGVLRRLRGG